jgi:UDP-N-acetylglucosamine 2-epimerase (non-hydrolysing)
VKVVPVASLKTLQNWLTERPETIDIGTNYLVGNDFDQMGHLIDGLENGQWKKGVIPPLWDGKAAQRIVEHIISEFRL